MRQQSLQMGQSSRIRNMSKDLMGQPSTAKMKSKRAKVFSQQVSHHVSSISVRSSVEQTAARQLKHLEDGKESHHSNESKYILNLNQDNPSASNAHQSIDTQEVNINEEFS